MFRRRRIVDQSSRARILIANALVNLRDSGITGTGSVTEWTNLGTGGSAYDLDVVVGTGANVKPHPSDSMVLFGASGDFASTPDSAAIPSGDLTWIFDWALDDWTPSAAQALSAQWDTGDQAILLRVETNGRFRFFASNDGTAAPSATSSAAPTINNGERLKIKVDFDISEDGVTFSTRLSDSDPWVVLGTPQTLSGSIASIHNSSLVLEVGSAFVGTSNRATGSCFRSSLYNGIQGSGGTLAVDFNAADYVNRSSDTAFPSTATSEIWTLNANVFIQNTGHKVSHSIGSVGLESTAGQDIASPGTVFMVARSSPADPAATQQFFGSRSNAGARWQIHTRQTAADKFSIFQGVAEVTMIEAYDTDAHVFTGQFNGDSTTKLTVSSVGNISGDGGDDSWDYGTLFADRNSASTLAGYVATLIVFDYALSESDITAMQKYLAAEYSL